jgi:hypothetical protein
VIDNVSTTQQPGALRAGLFFFGENALRKACHG